MFRYPISKLSHAWAVYAQFSLRYLFKVRDWAGIIALWVRLPLDRNNPETAQLNGNTYR